MSLIPGFLVIDKPAGITSHDVVAMVRAVTGIRKVGHTGTLDPFATGVLPLALGPATRLIRFLDESEKVYDATIALGRATDTGDPTGEVVREAPIPALDPESVRHVLHGFLGEQMQTPPRYSAVKVRGRRMYDYARRGEDVEAEARQITIHSAELLELGPDSLRVLLCCSRGTYARVLADDIAQALGTAGHLRCLTRRRSGLFDLENAVSLATIAEIASGSAEWKRVLKTRRGEERVPWRSRDIVREGLIPWGVRPIQALSHLPLLPVSAAVADLILNGGQPPGPPPAVRLGDRYLVVLQDELLAIVESRGDGKGKILWRLGQRRG